MRTALNEDLIQGVECKHRLRRSAEEVLVAPLLNAKNTRNLKINSVLSLQI